MSPNIDWTTSTTYSTVSSAERSSIKIFGGICVITVRIYNSPTINNNSRFVIFPDGSVPARFVVSDATIRFPTIARGNTGGFVSDIPVEITSGGAVAIFNWGSGTKSFEIIGANITLLASN